MSVECPTSAHRSTLNIKRAVYRTSSANTSRDYSETDISARVRELCPRQSTCRFDLAARDVTPARTTQRVGRYHDDHIDISYSCQSSASVIIQPTSYRPPPQTQHAKPGSIRVLYFVVKCFFCEKSIFLTCYVPVFAKPLTVCIACCCNISEFLLSQ